MRKQSSVGKVEEKLETVFISAFTTTVRLKVILSPMTIKITVIHESWIYFLTAYKFHDLPNLIHKLSVLICLSHRVVFVSTFIMKIPLRDGTKKMRDRRNCIIREMEAMEQATNKGIRFHRKRNFFLHWNVRPWFEIIIQKLLTKDCNFPRGDTH